MTLIYFDDDAPKERCIWPRVKIGHRYSWTWRLANMCVPNLNICVIGWVWSSLASPVSTFSQRYVHEVTPFLMVLMNNTRKLIAGSWCINSQMEILRTTSGGHFLTHQLIHIDPFQLFNQRPQFFDPPWDPLWEECGSNQVPPTGVS